MINHTTERGRFESPTFEEERSKPMRKGLFSVMCAAFAVAMSAVPSWSQTISGTSGVTFAKEIFGGEANPILGVGAQNVTVAYNYATNNLTAGRNATFTFTLSAGTFADPPNLLGYSNSTDMSIEPGVVTVENGLSSVSYAVRSTNAAPLTSGAGTFTFTVPRITGVGSVLGADPSDPISIEVAVTPAVAGQPGGFPVFPAMTTSASDRKHDIATSTYAMSYNPGGITPPVGSTSTAAIIALTDRSDIDDSDIGTAAGQVAALTSLPASAGARTQGVVLSVFQMFVSTAPLKADGTTAFASTADSNGNLVVTARGSFADDDVIFFSADTTYAESEALSVNVRTGTATGSFPLSAASGSVLAAQYRLYYVPAPGMLRQNTIRASYELDFTIDDADGGYASRTVEVGANRITFSGVNDMAFAYAIPNPAVGDVGNLRIRCQGSAECTVFLDCVDEDGARLGSGDLAEVMIPGGALMHYSSKTTLPQLLGVSSWTGRLSCNIMSNEDISVQVLTRSGDVLVNNTYISGLEPNPGSGPTNTNPSN